MNSDYFCDGAGFNNKISKFCVARNFEDYRIFEFEKDYTNNEMEYLSFIYAMFKCKEGSTLFGDSKLVVEQVKGNWKVKAYHLRPLVELAKIIAEEKKIKLCWLPRKDNVAGVILDKKKKEK